MAPGASGPRDGVEAPAAPPPGPLAGLRVLDLSRVLSGPYCTLMLADLGADVVKVESPEGGDEARHFLPLAADGRSAYFAAVNRGKRSIALDLRAPADRARFETLLAAADVLVENFRPGVMDRLGLAPTGLRVRHPRLVIASISGFGQTGPYRGRAAYDVVVQAMSGLMSITGHAGGDPVRVGSSIGDLAAALFACNGIQAALWRRERTGQGAHVDVAMLESQIALLEGALPALHAHGRAPGPLGARHPGTAPFDVFRTADGHLAIAAGSDHLFAALGEALGQPGWRDEPRFIDRAGRVAHQAELKACIEAVLETAPSAHWLTRLEAAGVPAGPLNDVAAMLQDPQVQARGAVPEIAGTGGQRAPFTPIRLDGAVPPAELPGPPQLDADRDALFSGPGAWVVGADAPRG